MIRAVPLALAIALLAAVPAAAEPVELTAQAKAAHTEFLLKATPPGPAATICLVDTGVNVNADTSGVIERIWRSPARRTDQSPTLHGTSDGDVHRCAVERVRDGRHLAGGADRQRPRERRRPGGVHRGQLHQRRQALQRRRDRVRESRSWSSPAASEFALTPDEREALVDEVSGARATGISFVAAAGNNGGGPVGTPANIPGILPVGATDSAPGALCPFSATARCCSRPAARSTAPTRPPALRRAHSRGRATPR